MRVLLFIVLSAGYLLGQTVYEIPFALSGNEIELELHNDSDINLNNVSVNVVTKPTWIKFISEQEVISYLESDQSGKIVFMFDVDLDAEILKESLLKFQIRGNNEFWEKEIRITVLPPETFELNQNYPNPFNPSTTIGYIIPKNNNTETSAVQLKIFDIVGREVETLVDKSQKPGYYKTEWNASNYASGMYIYQLSMKSGNNDMKYIRKKLMLMK